MPLGAVKINQNIIEDKDILITKENFIAHPDKKKFYYSIVFVGNPKDLFIVSDELLLCPNAKI